MKTVTYLVSSGLTSLFSETQTCLPPVRSWVKKPGTTLSTLIYICILFSFTPQITQLSAQFFVDIIVTDAHIK